jgi:hypothetical protein
MNIKINTVGEKIQIDSMYNPDFVKKIKAAGGKWNTEMKVWEMDSRAIETARKICRDVYGMDDMGGETVTLRVKVLEDINAFTSPVVIAGRVVATAWGRDSGAKIGDGVSFIEKSPDSGGSVKNWVTTVPKDAVIDLFDIPLCIAEKSVDNPTMKYDFPLYAAEIKDAQTDKVALLAERERLMARLSEINALVGDTK